MPFGSKGTTNMFKATFTRAALAAVLICVSAPAASALTIGMVDTMRVLNDYQGVGSAEKQFKAQVEKLKKAYEDRLRKLQDARKKNMPKAQLEALERKYTSEI